MEANELDKTMSTAHTLHAFFTDMLYEKPDFYGQVEVKFQGGKVHQVVKAESIKLPAMIK